MRSGQMDALGQILGGPIIGIIATVMSVSAGLLTSSLLVAPMVLFYVYWAVKNRKYIAA